MADMLFWKLNDFCGTSYSKVFEVADYEFDIGFSEFKMADPIWWTRWKRNIAYYSTLVRKK